MANLHPVEPVVVLVHDVAVDGKKRPCGGVAMDVTVSYLQKLIDGDGELGLVCRGCNTMVGLDEVSGDEPYQPEYKPPKGGI